jgi:hypothetical protein
MSEVHPFHGLNRSQNIYAKCKHPKSSYKVFSLKKLDSSCAQKYRIKTLVAHIPIAKDHSDSESTENILKKL